MAIDAGAGVGVGGGGENDDPVLDWDWDCWFKLIEFTPVIDFIYCEPELYPKS